MISIRRGGAGFRRPGAVAISAPFRGVLAKRFHLIAFNGSVEEADVAFIIRDHDRAKFEAKKVLMGKVVDFINAKYGADTAVLNLRDRYYNMRELV